MQNIRTQIYLPEDLRQEIDRQRRQTGESLAQYLRKAAEQRLKVGKKKKAKLKKLADLLGSVSKEESGWKGINIMEWQREIRKDRKIFK